MAIEVPAVDAAAMAGAGAGRTGEASAAVRERLLAHAMARHTLSARGYHRVLKVARTIADLAGSDALDAVHVAEAIGYRPQFVTTTN